MLLQALAVGCGGFCGAVLRWLLTLVPHSFAFPLTVLLINAGGSFVIGFLYGAASSRAANHHLMLLLHRPASAAASRPSLHFPSTT